MAARCPVFVQMEQRGIYVPLVLRLRRVARRLARSCLTA